MKITSLAITSIFLCSMSLGQTLHDENKRDRAFYNASYKWFAAWELVGKDIYKVDKVRPVDFVFFDDKYVYSTSTTTIANGTPVRGCNLMNLSFKWKKALHGDSIILPDKSTVPVGLMSFAAEIPGKKNKSFFVMPLPGFWETSSTTSKEFGLEKLVTGVFIHEFSHSQQMQNFGKRMTLFEKQNNFGVAFSDDIVQDIFLKDSSYVSLYKNEVQKLFESVQDKNVDTLMLKDGLSSITKRQSSYFQEQFFNLKEIDNFFLTMEGLGQYSMYLWLIHPKGGNIEKNIAVKGVRRGGKWWSQDEGLALFLILDKLAKPSAWAKDMFGYNTESVIALINKQFQ